MSGGGMSGGGMSGNGTGVAIKAIVAMTLLAALSVSACGRKGDPVAPTPVAAEAQDEVERSLGY